MLLSKYRFKRLFREAYAKLRKLGPAAYWSNHLVAHDDWTTSKTFLDSINQFQWRNAQYPGYIGLMPVDKADGLVVVDYGCGPGNDLIGFSEFSKTKNMVFQGSSREHLCHFMNLNCYPRDLLQLKTEI